MPVNSATWLLVLALARHAQGAAAFLDMDEFNAVEAIKSVPGLMKGNFRIFKTGTGAMWRNRKAAAAVRVRHKQQGEEPTYPELLLLRKSADDTQKLVQAGFIYLAVPELLPAMLYFFPRAIPSTFETDARRARRYEISTNLQILKIFGLV